MLWILKRGGGDEGEEEGEEEVEGSLPSKEEEEEVAEEDGETAVAANCDLFPANAAASAGRKGAEPAAAAAAAVAVWRALRRRGAVTGAAAPAEALDEEERRSNIRLAPPCKRLGRRPSRERERESEAEREREESRKKVFHRPTVDSSFFAALSLFSFSTLQAKRRSKSFPPLRLPLFVSPRKSLSFRSPACCVARSLDSRASRLNSLSVHLCEQKERAFISLAATLRFRRFKEDDEPTRSKPLLRGPAATPCWPGDKAGTILR